MRRISLLALLLFGLTAQTQTIIFRTAEDLDAGRGEKKGDVVDVAPVMGRMVLVLADGEGRERIPCKAIWGFRYKEALFRIEPGSQLPVRLMSQHTLCYYENGLAHLTMQRDRSEAATFEFGEPSYLSLDRRSEIVPARFQGALSKSGQRFREAHPELRALLDCIGEGTDLEHNRQCVVDHEVAQEEAR